MIHLCDPKFRQSCGSNNIHKKFWYFANIPLYKDIEFRIILYGWMMACILHMIINSKLPRKFSLTFLVSSLFFQMSNYLPSVLTVIYLVKELAIPLQISTLYWFAPFISLVWDMMVGFKNAQICLCMEGRKITWRKRYLKYIQKHFNIFFFSLDTL